jgi:ribonuclease HI
MQVMKNTKHNSWLPVDEQHYKKTYLVRKVQEEEAEKELRCYERLPEEYPTNDTFDKRPT